MAGIGLGVSRLWPAPGAGLGRLSDLWTGSGPWMAVAAGL